MFYIINKLCMLRYMFRIIIMVLLGFLSDPGFQVFRWLMYLIKCANVYFTLLSRSHLSLATGLVDQRVDSHTDGV